MGVILWRACSRLANLQRAQLVCGLAKRQGWDQISRTLSAAELRKFLRSRCGLFDLGLGAVREADQM